MPGPAHTINFKKHEHVTLCADLAFKLIDSAGTRSLFINFLPTAIVVFGCAFSARWLPGWFVGKRAAAAAAAPPGVVVADVAGEVELSLASSSASLACAAGRRLRSLGEVLTLT